MRKFNPLAEDHPVIGRQCGICQKPFIAGDVTTLVTVPGRGLNRPAIPVHWACAEQTKDDNQRGMEEFGHRGVEYK